MVNMLISKDWLKHIFETNPEHMQHVLYMHQKSLENKLYVYDKTTQNYYYACMQPDGVNLYMQTNKSLYRKSKKGNILNLDHYLKGPWIKWLQSNDGPTTYFVFDQFVPYNHFFTQFVVSKNKPERVKTCQVVYNRGDLRILQDDHKTIVIRLYQTEQDTEYFVFNELIDINHLLQCISKGPWKLSDNNMKQLRTTWKSKKYHFTITAKCPCNYVQAKTRSGVNIRWLEQINSFYNMSIRIVVRELKP